MKLRLISMGIARDVVVANDVVRAGCKLIDTGCGCNVTRFEAALKHASYSVGLQIHYNTRERLSGFAGFRVYIG